MKWSQPIKIFLAVVVVIASAVALVLVHLDNRRLRRHIAERVRQHQAAAELRADNARLTALLESNARNAETAAADVRAQAQQLRAEIAEVEQRAAAQHAKQQQQSRRDTEALETNRDPKRGLMRLEHFRDAGQATPTAAFEALVWSALKGDEAKLVQTCTLAAETRTQAEALLARLPEDARAQWTPEKLVALWVTGALTALPALEITGESRTDADHAVVTFRGSGMAGEEKLKFKLTSKGWKGVIGPAAISKLERKLTAAGEKAPQ